MIVQGFTALMSASYNGHREIVRLLLDAGANRNQYQTEVRRIYLLKGLHVGCATGQNRFVFCVQLWKDGCCGDADCSRSRHDISRQGDLVSFFCGKFYSSVVNRITKLHSNA
jgi:hypothetical protein